MNSQVDDNKFTIIPIPPNTPVTFERTPRPHAIIGQELNPIMRVGIPVAAFLMNSDGKTIASFKVNIGVDPGTVQAYVAEPKAFSYALLDDGIFKNLAINYNDGSVRGKLPATILKDLDIPLAVTDFIARHHIQSRAMVLRYGGNYLLVAESLTRFTFFVAEIMKERAELLKDLVFVFPTVQARVPAELSDGVLSCTLTSGSHEKLTLSGNELLFNKDAPRGHRLNIPPLESMGDVFFNIIEWRDDLYIVANKDTVLTSGKLAILKPLTPYRLAKITNVSKDTVLNYIHRYISNLTS